MKQIAFTILLITFLLSCGRSPLLEVRSGELQMSIDPQTGGRIASLTYRGVDFLKTERDSQNLQWGSTVWPAPQSAWRWPPPKLMDQGEYKVVEATTKRVILQSQPNAYQGLQVEKSFVPIGIDTIRVTYTFINQGPDSLRTGIWENARVPLQGEASWEASENPPDRIPGWKESVSQTRLQLGAHLQKHKLFIKATAPGIRHELNGLVLERTWSPFTSDGIAPGQAPIEIYYDPFAQFAELEIQGPYEVLAPGDQTILEVYWTVRPGKP